jgi:mannose-1-phosphate guanylyltransferase
LLNDQWVIDEIKEEIKRFLELNENKSMIYQTMVGLYQTLDTAKVVFIAMSAYIKRTERSQINDLILHLKLHETQNKQKEKNNKNQGQN